MKKHLVSATTIGLSLSVTSLSNAEEDYDPFDENTILKNIEDKAIEKGKSVLSDLGKKLLSSAIDSYVPGLSGVLGLGGGSEATQTQLVLDAIEADGNKTRALLLDFWDWARSQANASVAANYDSTVAFIEYWNGLSTEARLLNRDALTPAVDDAFNVLAQIQNIPEASTRMDWLHSYTTLLNLTIALVTEHSELQEFGARYEEDRQSGETRTDWWNRLSSAERADVLAAVDNTVRGRVGSLLRSGTGINFRRYVARLENGSLPGGVSGQSDFVTVTNEHFSPVSYSQALGGWTYWVGRDPHKYCVNGGQYCTLHLIEKGSTGTSSGPRYYADFDGAADYYSSAEAAVNAHKQLEMERMVRLGYAPVRAFAELWWDTWGFGWWDRTVMDGLVDDYVDEVSDGWINFMFNITRGGMTAGELGYLYGYSLRAGLNAVDDMAAAAYVHPDYMDWRGYGISLWPLLPVYRFPVGVHLIAMRSDMRSRERFNVHYAGQPVSKLVAVL